MATEVAVMSIGMEQQQHHHSRGAQAQPTVLYLAGTYSPAHDDKSYIREPAPASWSFPKDREDSQNKMPERD